jgi:hypothetical protein
MTSEKGDNREASADRAGKTKRRNNADNRLKFDRDADATDLDEAERRLADVTDRILAFERSR